MNIRFDQVLKKETVFLDIEPFHNKKELFRFLSNELKKQDIIDNVEEFVHALNNRESMGSTFMGNGIAIPHGKSHTVKKSSVIFCRFKEPFLYQSCNGENYITLLFMIAIPENQTNDQYLKILASLAGLLAHLDFIEELKSLKNYDEMVSLFRNYIE